MHSVLNSKLPVPRVTANSRERKGGRREGVTFGFGL
jgi:hypothetical protein